MKSVFSALILMLAATPVLAAAGAVPAPAIGLGLPAIAAVVLVALIAFLLKHIKV